MRPRLLSCLPLLAGLLAHLPAAAQTKPAPNLPVVAVLDELQNQRAALRYYDAAGAPLPTGDGAASYEVLQRVDSAGIGWRVRRYDAQTQRPLLVLGFGGAPWSLPEGPSRQWYPSGQLREQASYRKGMAEGRLQTYYPNGETRRLVDYYKQKAVRAECFTAAGEPAECPPYHTFAQPTSGSPDVQQQISQTYPQYLPAGYAKPGKGIVYFAFYVDTLGRATAPRILRGDDEQLNTAVLEAIRQLPRFEPARLEGRLAPDPIEGFVLYSPAVAKRRKP
ncbi:hypothetical protein LJ737_17195 [Hymenobacter sp. 15J16-1T3B]|uniref:hypothetical protein n=1 Tax=Hymenobacter sp. 15J16-1T3B TaxID=2886941 RepID=UPI001D107D75|nr:hypothetical protein [Hymenobacter sp. 15J16-1T3B]MCC3158982.1 hypothetical protein [Hymenobacter sp. 15J16-1T3B]